MITVEEVRAFIIKTLQENPDGISDYELEGIVHDKFLSIDLSKEIENVVIDKCTEDHRAYTLHVPVTSTESSFYPGFDKKEIRPFYTLKKEVR